jgi:hypothetical protein
MTVCDRTRCTPYPRRYIALHATCSQALKLWHSLAVSEFVLPCVHRATVEVNTSLPARDSTKLRRPRASLVAAVPSIAISMR